MDIKTIFNILKKTIISAFLIIILIFAVGSDLLEPLGKILSGHGLDKMMTGRGITTNYIVFLISSSIFILVLVCVMILELKKKKRNK